MLHNVYATLVAQHGWDANARTDPTLMTGNAVFLHHFIDALLLQPCNPTCKHCSLPGPAVISISVLIQSAVVAARDAWIQADANRYRGANKCLLWKVFASRGLGVGAAKYSDSPAVPEDCMDETTTTLSSLSSTPSSLTVSSTASSSTVSSTIESSIVEPSTVDPSITSSTATVSPASSCVDPKCPVDLTGSTGVLITTKATLFTCAYAVGSCTWYLPRGVLRNTAQSNCPKTVTC
jgi:extracellular elastinolytic metalloproteinase